MRGNVSSVVFILLVLMSVSGVLSWFLRVVLIVVGLSVLVLVIVIFCIVKRGL